MQNAYLGNFGRYAYFNIVKQQWAEQEQQFK